MVEKRNVPRREDVLVASTVQAPRRYVCSFTVRARRGGSVPVRETDDSGATVVAEILSDPTTCAARGVVVASVGGESSSGPAANVSNVTTVTLHGARVFPMRLTALRRVRTARSH